MTSAAVLLAGLCSCAAVDGERRPPDGERRPADGVKTQTSEHLVELELVLPQRYQHWRSDLLQDWHHLQIDLEQRLARWPRQTQAVAKSPLRLTITASPADAHFLAERLKLPGNPLVPRTHPGERLALITLPRDDRLLANRAHPPRTWRETVRHEMVHLLACDRPSLGRAPAWFHEGLAEAMVALKPTPFPDVQQSAFGSSWVPNLRELQAVDGGGSMALHTVLAGEASEIRYSAWACLVLQLLQEQKSTRPWQLPFAHPTLAEFLASLPTAYGDVLPSPLPRGRELDFEIGGKELFMASLPSKAVVLQAGSWQARQPLSFQMRVGRTGAAMAGMVLRSQADPNQVLRIRMNTFGAVVASLESLQRPNTRAYQSRPQAGATSGWRDFELQVQNDEYGKAFLQLQSADYKRNFVASFTAPFQIEFYVVDGACEIRSQEPFLPLSHLR